MVYVACKEKQLPDMPPRKRAYLHFLNFNPKFGGIDFNVQSFETNGSLFQNLTYTQTWPTNGYASLLTLQDDKADTSWIDFNIRNHATGDTIIPQNKFNLYNDNQSSTTLILLDNNGTPELVKTLDNFSDDTDSTGNIRFMNLAASIPAATLISADSTHVVAIENLGYKSFTGFKDFKKGKHKLYVINNLTATKIDSFPNFDIKLKKNYAFYLIDDASTGQPKVIVEEMNR